MNVILCAWSSHTAAARQRQLETLRRSLANEKAVIGDYGDAGTGAKVHRPELAQVLRSLSTGEAQALYAFSLDRLVRSEEEVSHGSS